MYYKFYYKINALTQLARHFSCFIQFDTVVPKFVIFAVPFFGQNNGALLWIPWKMGQKKKYSNNEFLKKRILYIIYYERRP